MGASEAGRSVREAVGDYQFAQPRPAVPGAAPELAGPALSTAIREQWGLRIVPGKAPFRLVVLDSARLPTGN
jgi:uncharacterized protein (TIGR03435 family)